MKKLYISIAAVLMAGAINAQSAFFDQVAYIGAFPVTDNTAATDWTSGWSNFDPANTTYGTVDSVINTNITSNLTLSSSKVYQLVGNVAVTSGATLKIQAGTVIRGDKSSKSCLIITKGSKINAQGTANSPIVFTSNELPIDRTFGDWGGIIILGNGVINTPGTSGSCTGCGTSPNVNMIEGFAAYDAVQLYGGANNADSSGIFSYVRIEFPGVALSGASNSEINGLTLGGVGSKTKIDHVQVSFSGDDAFEWFGGAVNGKNLIAYRTFDDDLDTDFGYAGNVQFGLVVRDPDEADASKVESFESDNFNPGVGRTPVTSPVFSNITVVGPTRDGSTVPGSGLFLCAAQLRRNTATSIFNSIITGWPKGLQVEGSAAQDNFSAANDSVAVFGNNWIIGATNAIVTGASFSPQSFYQGFFSSDNNDSTKTNANVAWVNPFPSLLETTPDFRLQSSSLAKTAASFGDAKFTGLVLGVKNNEEIINTFSLYPNPAEGKSVLSFWTNGKSRVNVNVYDITGKLVKNVIDQESLIGNQTISINTESFNPGVYMVNVTTGGSNTVMKLIVR